MIEQWLNEHRNLVQQIKVLEVDRDAVRQHIQEYVSDNGPIATDTDDVVMTASSYRTTYSEKVVTSVIARLHRIAESTTDPDTMSELEELLEHLEDSQKTIEIKPYIKIKHK